MKLLSLIIICFLLSITFMSCGDNDPIDEKEVKGLDGEWKVISLTVDLESTVSLFGEGVTTTSTGSGEHLNYILNLDGGSFTTMGAYSLMLTSKVSINFNPTVISQSYNVDGSGTYTNSDNEITVTGQLFELEVDGVDFSEFSESTIAEYVVDGDVLTITQDLQKTTGSFSSKNTTKTKSQSVWARQ